MERDMQDNTSECDGEEQDFWSSKEQYWMLHFLKQILRTWCLFYGPFFSYSDVEDWLKDKLQIIQKLTESIGHLPLTFGNVSQLRQGAGVSGPCAAHGSSDSLTCLYVSSMHHPGLPLPICSTDGHTGVGTLVRKYSDSENLLVLLRKLGWAEDFHPNRREMSAGEVFKCAAHQGAWCWGAAGSSGSCPFSRFTSRIWLSIYQNMKSLQIEKDVNMRSPFISTQPPAASVTKICASQLREVANPCPALCCSRSASTGRSLSSRQPPDGRLRWVAPLCSAAAAALVGPSRTGRPSRSGGGGREGSGRGGLLAPGSCSKVSPCAKASVSLRFQLD